MENEIVKIFQEYSSHIEPGMSKDIQVFLDGRQDIEDYDLEMDELGKILINIKLNEFSKSTAKKLFLQFIGFIGYDGINLYINESSEQQIKYLYLTAAISNSCGAKMEICFTTA